MLVNRRAHREEEECEEGDAVVVVPVPVAESCEPSVAESWEPSVNESCEPFVNESCEPSVNESCEAVPDVSDVALGVDVVVSLKVAELVTVAGLKFAYSGSTV
jgi:hypothetical protein